MSIRLVVDKVAAKLLEQLEGRPRPETCLRPLRAAGGAATRHRTGRSTGRELVKNVRRRVLEKVLWRVETHRQERAAELRV